MLFFRYKPKLILTTAALCLIFYGCSNIGPISISRGRADYNEAINRTDDEQLLMAVVRGRYGETTRLLAVTSVSANLRFSANAGTEFGISKEEFYEWSVTPFKGGVALEENPTITYAPIQGERYLQQILSPIPLDLLILVVRSSDQPGDFFTMLVRRINDIRNPDFLMLPSEEPDPRFVRLVRLLNEFDKAGLSAWVKDPTDEKRFNLVIRNYAPEYSDEVREFLNLLRLSITVKEAEDIEIPIRFAIKSEEGKDIAIETRSTSDLIDILKASVEVPEEHSLSGFTIHYPSPGLMGRGIRIRMATERPERASVAVKYSDYWFFIDRADQRTKMTFGALRAVLDVIVSKAIEQQPIPVLTVPVSR